MHWVRWAMYWKLHRALTLRCFSHVLLKYVVSTSPYNSTICYNVIDDEAIILIRDIVSIVLLSTCCHFTISDMTPVLPYSHSVFIPVSCLYHWYRRALVPQAEQERWTRVETTISIAWKRRQVEYKNAAHLQSMEGRATYASSDTAFVPVLSVTCVHVFFDDVFNVADTILSSLVLTHSDAVL